MNRVQDASPSLARRLLRPCWRAFKPWYLAASVPFRRVPSFLIIGEQKCGTFALHYYLDQHPRLRMAEDKEPHFFDTHYDLGMAWYRAFFPYKWQCSMTGEATPNYLMNPWSPGRVQESLPGARFIVLLRNPVDRAYSQYRHNRKRKPWMGDGREGVCEDLSFEEALAQEEARLAGEDQRVADDPSYYSFALEHYSYKRRGHYMDHLAMWFEVFDRERFILVRTEDLYTQRAETTQRIAGFLGLEPYALRDDKDYHVGEKRDPIDPATRKELEAYFAPHNQRLYHATGLGWAPATSEEE